MSVSSMRASVYSTLGSGVLLSSATGIIKNHLLSKFPKNFFKYVYIKNSFPGVTEGGLDDDARMVKDRPALSLNLRYDFNEAAFAGDSFRWGLSQIPVRAYERSAIYRSVLMCEADRVFISAADDRVKLSYEVGLKVDSEVQAYNITGYVRNYIGVNRPYYLSKVDVEVPVPLASLAVVGEKLGIDVRSMDAAQRQTFHEYLTRWSGGTLTFKKNLSSGNWIYFSKYVCNILCRITDQPQIERVTEGKAVTEATVKFQLDIEFPILTHFITEFEPPLTGQNPTEGLDDMGDAVIYNFTTKEFLFDRQRGVRTLSTTFDFVTDLNTEADRTPLNEVLSEELVFFIEYMKKLLPNDPDVYSKNFEVLVTRDHDVVDPSEYEVDWDERELVLHNPRPNYVYRIGLYVDLVEFTKVMEVRRSLGYRQNDPVKKVAEIQEPYPGT